MIELWRLTPTLRETLSPPGGEGRVRGEMVNRPGVARSNGANVDVLYFLNATPRKSIFSSAVGVNRSTRLLWAYTLIS